MELHSAIAATGAFPKGFSIGLSPLADEPWLPPDERLAACLDEKQRLIASVPDEVFMARADTVGAQAEAWSRLADHLPGAFPDAYVAHGDGGAAVEVAGRLVRRDDVRPLESAARLVADDLVLMRKGEDGWRLVAASLCFPSFWRLEEKFDRPITDIHAPVPGFGAGTRNASLLERIFDRLQTGQPVKRSNWSIQEDGELHHREAHSLPISCEPDALARTFLRCEYQTLTKLAKSGDILFTIRVVADPLEALRAEPQAAHMLAERLAELDRDGLAYKGLTNDVEMLIRHLRAFPTAQGA